MIPDLEVTRAVDAWERAVDVHGASWLTDADREALVDCIATLKAAVLERASGSAAEERMRRAQHAAAELRRVWGTLRSLAFEEVDELRATLADARRTIAELEGEARPHPERVSAAAFVRPLFYCALHGAPWGGAHTQTIGCRRGGGQIIPGYIGETTPGDDEDLAAAAGDFYGGSLGRPYVEGGAPTPAIGLRARFRAALARLRDPASRAGNNGDGR
jgi:hypothetical protein